MKLSQFKFELPEELIAQYPSSYRYNDQGEIELKEENSLECDRDECRLLVLHKKSKTIEHKIFKEFINYFDEGDLVLFNDTQVFPARMHGNKEKTNANIEVFLLRELNPRLKLWDVLVEPARKIRVGNKLYFGPDNSLVAEVIDNTTARGRTVRFLYDGTHEEFKRDLFALGSTPLPEHITREPEPLDAERFQTIFATKEGSVLAPAAGINFTRQMLKRMEIKGIDYDFISLYLTVNMFRDIDVDDLTKHKSDSEQIDVNERVCELFNKANALEKRICAVGTTTLRTIETASTANGMIKPFEGWTNKFIFPPYDFTTANCLLSKLQLPKTTLLMTQSAFTGHDFLMQSYKEAIKMGYNFGFYGDSVLILPD